MIKDFLGKLLGDTNEREVQKLRPLVENVNTLADEYASLTETELKAKTGEFQQRIVDGASVDDVMPEAFAVLKDACRRLTEANASWDVRGEEVTWNMVPYDVQIMGGITLHRGRIAEMKTGEGKTLVCTFPLYLNALAGKGCHLVTANSYLATRDAEWMGGLFKYLGLTVGILGHGMTPAERKAAYACDITYGTNTEFGFDYLRDNMARKKEDRVQRGHAFALVDEVDSILIDEARTPLIISAPAEESTEKYGNYSSLIRNLQKNTHYLLDEKAKTATLTEDGVQKMEELLGVKNIYEEGGFAEVHHIEQALKAESVFTRDKDYVVQDGEIMIVDEFTGRLMPGRRFSDGLHQALEAKEGVTVKRESRTLATITLQNYFRMYDKLGGMTGTALTEAGEFHSIYSLDVTVIPTHRPIARKDQHDAVYKNETGKFSAVVKKVAELHEKGQPVLIGTVTIEKSEHISKLLQKAGVPHSVLNAKQHEQEAEIIAKAGERGAVTIATNMAGRGTDIKLGDGVAELGGLFILGTERHESRRIDNQLRGRAGRQGDAGESQFFVSMEDSLMRLFGGAQMQSVMTALNVPDDMPIENSMISSSIERAQKKVEAHNFEIRKHLVQYDDVMNAHREIVYKKRNLVLEHENIADEISTLTREEADHLVQIHASSNDPAGWETDDLVTEIRKLTAVDTNEKVAEFAKNSELKTWLEEHLQQSYTSRFAHAPQPVIRHGERQLYMATIDRLWMEHVENMKYLREKVSLRGYAQRDPLLEYKGEAYEMFNELLANIRGNTVRALFAMKIQEKPGATPAQPVVMKAQPQLSEMKTNKAAVEDVLTGDREFTEDQTKEALKAAEELLQADPELSKLGKEDTAVVKADSNEKIEVTKANNPTVIRVGADEGKTESAGMHNGYPIVGRNDPCPCGSGKKYKKCHGADL